MKKNSKTIKCALSSVVEHLVYIERVGGSIPSARTKYKTARSAVLYFCLDRTNRTPDQEGRSPPQADDVGNRRGPRWGAGGGDWFGGRAGYPAASEALIPSARTNLKKRIPFGFFKFSARPGN